MSRGWWRGILLLVLLPTQVSVPQQLTNTTKTTIASSSQSLQLPGSVTLKATVAPTGLTPAMPSGSVRFLNGSTLLGTAPLTTIPATEKFAPAPVTGLFGNQPFGLFALPSATSKDYILGALDYSATNPATGRSNPELTIYSGQNADLFSNPAIYSMANSGIFGYYPGVDAYATGDFNHDGVQDVLIHGYTGNTNEYYILPGKAGGTFDPAAGILSVDNSGITCDCSNPTQILTVDDFNGDGYPDIAYSASQNSTNGLTGVALNSAAAAPGSFKTFVTAPPITPTVDEESFESLAIASGHFTSSGYPDLVVAGYPSTGESGYVALYRNLGPYKGSIAFAVPVLVNAGNYPGAIATADFRANGMTDVVVANQNQGDSDQESGSVQVLFGDGKGGLATSSIVNLTVGPQSVYVGDFNNDGYPDILISADDGSLSILLNDTTGHFKLVTPVGTSAESSYTAIGDFNGDGLPDIVALSAFPLTDGGATSTAFGFLNSASSQATFVAAAKTLPAGTDTLTANFPGDDNLAASTSTGLPVAVTMTATSLAWPAPPVVEYGAPLSATQLNATASVPGVIAYTPAAGTILPPGSTKVTATFAPTDGFDYSGTTASQTVTVAAPTFTSIAPASGKLGDPSTTVTVNGQGFIKGATAYWNGAALATTWVNLNQLTAVIPASLLTTAGTYTITVVDPNKVAVTGTEKFTVIASNAVANANAPSTVEAGQTSSLTLTVSPYPAAITATVTLNFVPDTTGGPVDPTVLFANNTTTEVIQIPANSTAAIPAIDFSTGSTAGTIAITVQLLAGGVNITPPSLLVIPPIVVPATAPVITSVTLTRTGKTLTVNILGLSSTRDMTAVNFQFTAAPGASLKTTSLSPTEAIGQFTGYYQSATSDPFGTTFLYSQIFTLDSDATDVGSVIVTLTNSQGASQPVTAQ